MLRQSIIGVSMLTFVGCAAYHVGPHSLYAPDVTTVYVPMIESGSYRRDLGERLTEAVAKEIELKTPYKLVGTPAADSILQIRLLGDTRKPRAQNTLDDPRVSESGIFSEGAWVNRRREPIGTTRMVAMPDELVNIEAT